MKKLCCLFCALALLCTAVLPVSAAGEKVSVPWQDCMQTLKEHAAVQEIWIPKLAPSFTFQGVDVFADGSYAYRADGNRLLGEGCSLHQISLVLVTGDRQDARLSPYLALCQQKSAAASVDASVWSGWTIEDSVLYESQDSNQKSNYQYYGTLSARYNEQPVIMNSWSVSTRRGNDVGVGVLYEIVLPVSQRYWMSVQLASIGANEGVERPEDLPAAILQQLGLTTLGDADLNGEVNAADCLVTLKHAVSKAEITDELAFALADWNNDDALDAADGLRTLQKAVGKVH